MDSTPAVSRDVLGMVSIQCFQGNWELNQSLATLLGKTESELKSQSPVKVKVNTTIYTLYRMQLFLLIHFLIVNKYCYFGTPKTKIIYNYVNEVNERNFFDKSLSHYVFVT